MRATPAKIDGPSESSTSSLWSEVTFSERFMLVASAMSKSSGNPFVHPRARLLILDVGPLSGEGMRAIINRDGRFEVCDQTATGESVVEIVKRHRPDLLLIDPFKEGRDGVLLIKDLVARFPKSRILAVSHKPEEVYAERILRAGAHGYWMKSGASEELVRAIETVLADGLYVSGRVAVLAVRKLVEAQRPIGSFVGGLTDRELHVFSLIGAGQGPGQIAADLGLSRKTIETYQDRIKTKLDFHDAKELRASARTWLDSLTA